MARPVSSFSDKERKAYLLLLFNLAFHNGLFSRPELEMVYKMAEAAEIPKEWVEQTIAECGKCDEQKILNALEVLAHSELKFPFLRDLYLVANADHCVEEKEFKEIEFIEEHLDLTTEQKEVLQRFSIDLVAAQNAGQGTEEIAALIQKYEEEFNRCGIPHSITAQSYAQNTLWNFEVSISQLDETTGMLALLVSPIIFTYEGLRFLLNRMGNGASSSLEEE
ncbi:MAG: hypothetical protein RML72_04590 [Bacteroidia bacterium]|nr:hypothetical protein [Bacteroidia bacterium]MDW8158140.1 hypothetical protein [Bacteroidia bacterium]